MLKNIKLFSTDNDRITYESSASYETPYVSKVAADNSVHYNKVAQIIEFTIHIWRNPNDYIDHTYQAVEGMTFEEWMNSEYSNTYATDIWNIDECDQFRLLYIDGNIDNNLGLLIESNFIEPSDTIISNQLYNTSTDTDCW